MQSEDYPINSKIRTLVEVQGTHINGMVYGYLPKGVAGVIIGYTDDGRAIMTFPGYGVHTFHDPTGVIAVEGLKNTYSKYEYRTAKGFLKDSKSVVLSSYSDDTIKRTYYNIAGQVWFESESRLESPHNEYSLQLTQRRVEEFA